MAIDATGAGGSAVSGGAGGGSGGQVSGTAAVTHGQVLDICVNFGGGAGGSGGGAGGSGGGAGGGASGVSIGSNFASPAVVAGGGGGGGGGSLAGTGGAAGQPGTGSGAGSGGAGTPSNASGPGAGGAGSGTGGGGGGGYAGGTGGSSGSVGSGGGGGGTNFCNASGCTMSAATGSPQVTLTYTVAPAPSVSVATPADGAFYPLGQQVSSSFSCGEGSGGPGLVSCADQNGHGSGTPIDTSTPGTHTFTATAQSADGLSSSRSATYTVAAPPRIWLPLPANGDTFTVGQVVDSYYVCADGSGGPGVKSCVDQNGQPAGAQIDTSTVGSHTFTVTATSQDGQTASTSVVYRVIPAPTVSHVVAHRGGLVTLVVTVYGPGTIDVMSTAGLRSFALAADAVDPPPGSFVFGSARVVASRAQTVPVRVGLSQAGKLLFRDHRRASLRLSVLYTTPGGSPQLVKSLALSARR